MKRLAVMALIVAAWAVPNLAAETAAASGPRPTIRQRQRNQQKRIASGAASGQLTPRETAGLKQREAALNRTIRRDRKDGAGLTPAERRKIDRRQDRLSRDIYRQKHDNNTAAPK